MGLLLYETAADCHAFDVKHARKGDPGWIEIEAHPFKGVTRTLTLSVGDAKALIAVLTELTKDDDNGNPDA